MSTVTSAVMVSSRRMAPTSLRVSSSSVPTLIMSLMRKTSSCHWLSPVEISAEVEGRSSEHTSGRANGSKNLRSASPIILASSSSVTQSSGFPSPAEG